MSDRRAALCLLLLQLTMVPLAALLLTYGRDADPKALKAKSTHLIYYPMFQDVHVMILVGFGFLMTFLRRYGYSSLSFNFLLCSFVMQWAIICYSFVTGPGVTVYSLIKADILVASILISYGCVLGKTSPLQLVFMALLETPVYILNEFLGERLNVPDPGGSIFVHAFGAYFGLSVSKMLGKPKNKTLEVSSYTSDIFSMLGSVFLWVFWPSFNGILSTEDNQQRAVINTYLSLAASCLVTFSLSALLDKKNKFTMAHIQNATLAGGVAVGTVAELVLQPYGALLTGTLGGAISTIGFIYIQPWLERRVGLHDTCGVHNLHGMPAILAGVSSAILAALATPYIYGPKLYVVYKARAPEAFSPELIDLQHSLIQILPGESRSALAQGGYQILALVLTLTVAILSGTLTGIALKVCRPCTRSVPEEYVHDDCLYWELPEKDPEHVRTVVEGESNNTLNVI